MKNFKEIRNINEANKQIEVPWDMDDPREYMGDFQDVGVYLDKWDRKDATIVVSGNEKDLISWLISDFGYDKKEAQTLVRKGKRVK